MVPKRLTRFYVAWLILQAVRRRDSTIHIIQVNWMDAPATATRVAYLPVSFDPVWHCWGTWSEFIGCSLTRIQPVADAFVAERWQ